MNVLKDRAQEIRKIVDSQSKDSNILIMTEEVAEFIKEVSKYRRSEKAFEKAHENIIENITKKKELSSDLIHKRDVAVLEMKEIEKKMIEEMADALICIVKIKHMYQLKEEAIEKEINEKIDKTLELIEKGELY